MKNLLQLIIRKLTPVIIIVSLLECQQMNGAPLVGLQQHISMIRDPMPWEDGYFDPTYHVWPKSRHHQQVVDKQAIKLTNEQSAESGKSIK